MRGWWYGSTIKAGHHWQSGIPGGYFYKYSQPVNDKAPFFWNTLYSAFTHDMKISKSRPVYFRFFTSNLKFDSAGDDGGTTIQFRFTTYDAKGILLYWWFYTGKGKNIPQTKGEKKTINLVPQTTSTPALSAELECISAGKPGDTSEYWDFKLSADFPTKISKIRALLQTVVTSYAGQENPTEYTKSNPPYFTISNKEPDR